MPKLLSPGYDNAIVELLLFTLESEGIPVSDAIPALAAVIVKLALRTENPAQVLDEAVELFDEPGEEGE